MASPSKIYIIFREFCHYGRSKFMSLPCAQVDFHLIFRRYFFMFIYFIIFILIFCKKPIYFNLYDKLDDVSFYHAILAFGCYSTVHFLNVWYFKYFQSWLRHFKSTWMTSYHILCIQSNQWILFGNVCLKCMDANCFAKRALFK